MRRRMLASIGGAKKKPTARDYVQDGLIAMWDGIENAGWGVHDANATVWKDLIGEINAEKTQPSDLRWQGDCIAVNSGYFKSVIGDRMLDAFMNDNVTIEVVCDSQNTAYGHMFSIGGGVREEYWVGYNLNPYITYGSTSFNQIITGLKKIGRCTHTFTFDKGVAKIYTLGELNGQKSDVTVSARPNASSVVKLFGDRTFTGFGCCVRVYNRALTADEIAHNYAIDKARFGLP